MNKLVDPFFCVVHIPLYRQNIVFSINQTIDEFSKSLIKCDSIWRKASRNRKEKVKEIVKTFIDPNSNVQGRTVLFDSGMITVQLHEIESIYFPENLATFNHELFHAVTFMATNKGLELNVGSEEAYAYLSGFITEEFFKAYQKKNQL